MTETVTVAAPTILRNIPVAMRDGVRLATSVYLPPGEGPFPTVLVRTAYNRVPMDGGSFVRRGMAFVAQDCRGRYASEGDWYPFVNEGDDGADTLAWIAAQPWCNGRIAMFGDSYLAATQFAAAASAGDRLCAINPRFMAGDCWKRAYYCDGAFSLALTWSWLCFETSSRTSEAAMLPLFDVPALLRTLPIVSMDEASGGGVVPAYRDYVLNSRHGEHWRRIDFREQLEGLRVPALFVGGWYDYYAAETFANFEAARRHAPHARLRDSHRVVVGPWTHGISGSASLGELDFGPEALAEDDITGRWLERMLRDGDASAFQAAPIRIFVMGANRWRDEHEWPLARTVFTDLYLRTGGDLRPEAPGDEPADHYLYDPADPVPTLGGNHSVGPYNPGLYELCRPGPFDQRPVEQRDDVLAYTSEPLEQDTEVTGPVTVTLFAASSGRDTDFVARLTDVHPDDRSINITEGVIRARFREDIRGEPSLLEPGRVYRFDIDLGATSNLFRRGHRIRLQITSSNFPLLDRNLNTGNDPATDVQMQVAEQTVHHDRRHPSSLRLPIVPR